MAPRFSRIVATGAALPARAVSNDELAQRLARAALKRRTNGSSPAPAFGSAIWPKRA